MVLKPCVVLAALVVAAVSSQTIVGGRNIDIPLAEPTIPFDKCSVAAANDASMKLTAFSWGYNNEFWRSAQQDNWGPWSAWESIGGFFVGGPTVIRNANNDIVVFGVGVDTNVAYKVFKGAHSTTEWLAFGEVVHESTPVKIQSRRVSAVLDPQGLLHIYVRAASHVFERRQYANGTEAVWGDWSFLGATVTSDVAAVADAEGLIHLFARGVDGFLWTLKQELHADGSVYFGEWSKAGWEAGNDDAVFLSSSARIVARLNAQNLVEVVVRGADKALWHVRQTVNDNRGVVWSPFKSLSGVLASGASLQINSDSLLVAFAVGAEKGIWYKQQAHHPVDSASDAWSHWIPLGGRFSSGVDVVPDSRGYINIFGRGIDRAIWNRVQNYSNHTVAFLQPWSNLGGRFRSFAC